MRITTDLHPGSNVTVGDVLIGFDADGICTGIVSYSDGRPHENVGLLAPEHIEVLRSVPEVFTVTDDPPKNKGGRPRKVVAEDAPPDEIDDEGGAEPAEE